MLVLTRKSHQVICIGDSIQLQILDIKKGRVKIGLSCPPTVPVLRGELRDHALIPAAAPDDKVVVG